MALERRAAGGPESLDRNRCHTTGMLICCIEYGGHPLHARGQVPRPSEYVDRYPVDMSPSPMRPSSPTSPRASTRYPVLCPRLPSVIVLLLIV